VKPRFIDLFAGIGGFHAVGSTFDWECVLASDFDKRAATIYEQNWGNSAYSDITQLATEKKVNVPDHDVLFGGFPCQPFSKSGNQRGMDETRGTLFWNISRIIQVKKPSLVLLENVRNLAGPRHIHEWKVIIETLRKLGYRVSDEPTIASPHKLHPEWGGRPQVRERVFIAATKVIGSKSLKNLSADPLDLAHTPPWSIDDWNLEKHLPLNSYDEKDSQGLKISKQELDWIQIWDDFVQRMLKERNGLALPGFPLWAEIWVKQGRVRATSNMPDWKKDFIKKNRDFYFQHKKAIDSWLKDNPKFLEFPPSRMKLEWQAQNAKSLWETVLHFRPSGIRAKRATYVPALVAITQTSVFAKEGRKLSVEEAKRLQGLPEWFSFADQSAKDSYKQLGNGLSVGVAFQILKAHVMRDRDLLTKTCPEIISSVEKSPNSPDLVLETMFNNSQKIKRSKDEAVFL
jgi:DNA (cytosine-5)-methyltransferase 1